MGPRVRRLLMIPVHAYFLAVWPIEVCLLARVYHVSPWHIVKSLRFRRATRGLKTMAPDLPRPPDPRPRRA